MIPEKFKSALFIIEEGLFGKGIRYAYVGSFNLALRGIDVIPRDLDIVTSSEGIRHFEKIFHKFICEPLKIKKAFREGEESYFSLKLDISGVEVEIIGESSSNFYFRKINEGKIERVKIGRISLPVVDIREELKLYELRGFDQKVKLIRQFIHRQR